MSTLPLDESLGVLAADEDVEGIAAFSNCEDFETDTGCASYRGTGGRTEDERGFEDAEATDGHGRRCGTPVLGSRNCSGGESRNYRSAQPELRGAADDPWERGWGTGLCFQ